MNILQYWLTSCPSTMEEAKQLVPSGQWGLVVSDLQTEGRGTQGRIWKCVEGNLFLTLSACKHDFGKLSPGLWPIVTGLALWETTCSLMNSSQQQFLNLKWPNDLLLFNRKAAGMLLEVRGSQLLIGVGVNIVAAPSLAESERKSACLSEAGVKPEMRKVIAVQFAEKLHEYLVTPPPLTIIKDKWSACIDWNSPTILRSPAGPWATGTHVHAIELDNCGGLWVCDDTGHKEMLVATYLY